MNSYTVAESLKKVRKQHNFKQREIAEAIGIDRSTYSFYETGKTFPTIGTLCALAKIYNVTVGYLIGNETYNYRSAPPVKAEVSSTIDPIAFLNEEERLLLMYYRIADERTKEEVMKVFLPHDEENKTS